MGARGRDRYYDPATGGVPGPGLNTGPEPVRVRGQQPHQLARSFGPSDLDRWRAGSPGAHSSAARQGGGGSASRHNRGRSQPACAVVPGHILRHVENLHSVQCQHRASFNKEYSTLQGELICARPTLALPGLSPPVPVGDLLDGTAVGGAKAALRVRGRRLADQADVELGTRPPVPTIAGVTSSGAIRTPQAPAPRPFVMRERVRYASGPSGKSGLRGSRSRSNSRHRGHIGILDAWISHVTRWPHNACLLPSATALPPYRSHGPACPGSSCPRHPCEIPSIFLRTIWSLRNRHVGA